MYAMFISLGSQILRTSGATFISELLFHNSEFGNRCETEWRRYTDSNATSKTENIVVLPGGRYEKKVNHTTAQYALSGDSSAVVKSNSERVFIGSSFASNANENVPSSGNRSFVNDYSSSESFVRPRCPQTSSSMNNRSVPNQLLAVHSFPDVPISRNRISSNDYSSTERFVHTRCSHASSPLNRRSVPNQLLPVHSFPPRWGNYAESEGFFGQRLRNESCLITQVPDFSNYQGSNGCSRGLSFASIDIDLDDEKGPVQDGNHTLRGIFSCFRRKKHKRKRKSKKRA